MPTPAIRQIMERREEYYEKFHRPPRRIYLSQWFFEILLQDVQFSSTFIPVEYFGKSKSTNEKAVGKIFGMDVYVISDFELATEKWEDY